MLSAESLRVIRLLLLALLAVVLVGCSSPSYQYRYIPGRTATIQDGYAVAPPAAPERVQAAIAAGNRLIGLPYRYGGGHASSVALDTGYDCSGSASYVLSAAGVLNGPRPSRGFRSYGASGEGKWISIYARRDHVFVVVAGLRFDTGYLGNGSGDHGPRWTMRSRPARGAVIRHPVGL